MQHVSQSGKITWQGHKKQQQQFGPIATQVSKGN